MDPITADLVLTIVAAGFSILACGVAVLCTLPEIVETWGKK